jgi:hypothetical protein
VASRIPPIGATVSAEDKETPAKSPHSVVSMYEDSSITLVCHKPDLTDCFPFKESG